MKIRLPSKPVDGYTVTWWQWSCEGDYVNQYRAVYHVNTPWNTYAPDEPGRGVALVDDWMIEKHEQNGAWWASGRCTGWTDLLRFFGEDRDDKFASREACLRNLVDHLDSTIVMQQNRLTGLRALLKMREQELAGL